LYKVAVVSTFVNEIILLGFDLRLLESLVPIDAFITEFHVSLSAVNDAHSNRVLPLLQAHS
jgi:hypothetical protein